MGVLPLVFQPGEGWQQLGLDGSEEYTIRGTKDMQPRKKLQVTARKSDGATVDFEVTARLDTDIDVDYFLNGGILPYVIRRIMADGGAS
jgi:aconitate hydratase